MFISDLKKDFFDVICSGGSRVLILVNFDVDALCGVKILQYLLQCDHVPYSLLPIKGKTDLIQQYKQHPGATNILINCGGNVDLVELLDPEENAVFFVMDSHSPPDVCNVFSESQVRLLNAPDPSIPQYEKIFQDDEDEENEEDEGEKTRENRRWEQERNRILFNYLQFSYYGSSSALLMYELAWKMSRDNNDLLWWAIIGITEQYILLKTETDKYVLETGNVRHHVSRLNQTDDSVDSMKLSFDKELNLNLYRHWSVFDSLHHTAYTASKFKVWTLKGKQRLYEFLAELGLPLIECKQNFATMDLSLRNNIIDIFESKSSKYNMESITYGSFTASFGYRHKFCASDVVYALISLMEKTESNESFLKSLDSLSRSHIDSLNLGIDRAKEKLEILMGQVQTFLDLRLIVSAGPFLYAIIQDGTPNSQFFSSPNSLTLLGQFTLRAHASVTQSKKVGNLPLVISAPLNPEKGTCLVLGVPPISDRSRKNLLGKAFEQSAQKTGSKYLLDYFDPSLIQLKTEDRSKFFDGLISILT
ncbi:cell division control protein 45 homolog [Lepeophtheirus salmonis]|nr:cell division control protein 45 homolog [Lepeophtheirus salmonis]